MDYNELTVIRPISKEDLLGFYQLALQAGIGMTSLPKDNNLLLKKINTSLKSFENLFRNLDDYLFLFVLENIKNKKIIGCSGIVNVGTSLEPAFFFNVDAKNSNITLQNHYQGAAELCSLFLSKDFRKNDNGKLLSRSRLLFMSLNHIFKDKKIIAEMRGYFDENNESPFWNYFFKDKFDMSSEEAIEIRANGDKQKIIDMIGLNPIKIESNAINIENIIGQVHSSTKAAKSLLEREGLRYNNYVDLIDSGPALEANLYELETIKNKKQYKVNGFLNDRIFEGCAKYIVSNNNPIEFRACISQVIIKNDGVVELPDSIENALNLEINSNISIVEL